MVSGWINIYHLVVGGYNLTFSKVYLQNMLQKHASKNEKVDTEKFLFP